MNAIAVEQPRSIGRSTWAVVAGLLAITILSLAVDQLFHVLDVYPPWGQPMNEPGDNALALSYRIILSVLGGWITARLAPQNPVKHALILAGIGLVLGVAGAIVTIPMKLGPAWFPILIPITNAPATWLGGVLFARKAGK